MAKLILSVNCLLVMLTIVRSADHVTEQRNYFLYIYNWIFC